MNLQSGGFSVGPAERGTDYSGLGKVMAGLAQSALYDEKRDPNAQRARLLGAQADGEERRLAGMDSLATTIDSMAELIKTNPEQAGETFRQFAGSLASQGIQSGYDPADLAEYMMFYSGNAQLGNDIQMNARSAAGKSPLGPDQALTQDRQDQIRGENFSQDMSKLAVLEAGRDGRSAGRGGAGGKPPKPVSFTDSERIADQLDVMLGLNADDAPPIDQKLYMDIRATAEQNAQSGMNPTAAVQSAIDSLAELNPATGDGDFIPFNYKGPTITRRQAPAPQPQAPAAQGDAPRRKRFNPDTGRLE